ncbi:nucleotidyl transferase domain-containing protein [Phthorimaea operculella]|nr:nucleotidyl transferase domain-containing protein [Phthorimaea operculella]
MWRSKTSETRAMILVGGYGTRLRPLTLTRPKPLVEFANKPIVLHQIEALAETGISQVILAVSYKAVDMEEKLTEEARKLGVTLIFSHEIEPLGTAGPLALARDLLNKNVEPFFVLNSDVICNFPFKDLLNFHKNHGKEGTILLTKVEEPSQYGVVISKENGQIEKFIEKPEDFITDKINAGIYVLNPSVLNRIELRAMSIEKEVFPQMVTEGQLCAMDLKGYWMDMGQPKGFIIGTSLYLADLREKKPSDLEYGNKDFIIVGNVLLDPSAKIGKGCRIGPDVTIGPDVIVEEGACIKKAVILQDAHIFQNAWIENCIIGWRSQVGRWVRIENMSVLGEDVVIKDEVYVNGGQVLPHKCVGKSIFQPEVLM